MISASLVYATDARDMPKMEAESKDPRTVFVKGVSFDWDNAEFEKAFSNVGPVRKCFLLKGAGKTHKVPPQTSLKQWTVSPRCNQLICTRVVPQCAPDRCQVRC